MLIKFKPFLYADNKKVYYLPKIKYLIFRESENKEEINKLIHLYGKKYIYEGEEFVVNRLKGTDIYILEKDMPTNFLIIRSYISRIINIMRSIAPYMYIADAEGYKGKVEVTLFDDEVDLNIVKRGYFTTDDVKYCYGRENKIFELVMQYYLECKNKGIGWNRPMITK